MVIYYYWVFYFHGINILGFYLIIITFEAPVAETKKKVFKCNISDEKKFIDFEIKAAERTYF